MLSSHRHIVVLWVCLGPELDQLIARAGVASVSASANGGDDSTNSCEEIVSPYIHVGPLNDEDKLSIAQSLLARYTKQFSSDQMDIFLSNPGASPCCTIPSLTFRLYYEPFVSLDDPLIDIELTDIAFIDF